MSKFAYKLGYKIGTFMGKIISLARDFKGCVLNDESLKFK